MDDDAEREDPRERCDDPLDIRERGSGLVGVRRGRHRAVARPHRDTAKHGVVATDQRGITRPQGAGTDRGAVEVADSVAELGELELGPDAAVNAGDTATLTVSRTGDASEAATAQLSQAPITPPSGVTVGARGEATIAITREDPATEPGTEPETDPGTETGTDTDALLVWGALLCVGGAMLLGVRSVRAMRGR